VENAEAIIALVDASGHCSFMNEYGMRLLGIDAERRAAQLFLDIYPVPDPEQLMRDVREAILSREGVTVEHSLRLPEADHLFRSAIRPVRDPDGQVRTALIFARDITHQREADEFRRRESAIGLAITELYGQIVSPKPSLDGITRAILRHACALTESPHGFVCSFSAEGKRAITAVSEQLMTDLGLDERDLPIRHVCSDSGLMPPLIEDVITSCNAQFSNRTQETPYRLMIPPGEMAIYRLLSVPITIDGEVLGQISVANASRDYTEMDTDSVVRLALYYALAIQRLRLQAESVHAKERAEQSERLKDTFIANMSHEIRTPLNIIRGYSEIISGRLSGRIEVQEREYLMSIERAGERLLRTVEHILNISSMQAGTFALNSQPINLVEKIDQIVQDMRSPAMEKGLDIRCGHDAPGLWIRADHYCIDQALLNILDNAIKFTDQGSIDIRSRREKEEACIMLRDTGIGISEQYLPRLYDTFSQEVAGYTRPFEGLGLGLALTKQYVSINGGSISVHSAKGVGTTVTLRFPAIDTPAEVSTARVPSPAPPASLFPRTILVVEDDEPSQELIKILLGKEHRLLISANAEDAWNLLQLEKIDLVLMDLSLRGKIDGLQLTAVIRGVERFRELPIIATTAHAFPRDRQRCLDAGCSEYLSKPFRREDLFALIHQFLPNP
jgi:PAS domain S-box-containing protein